MKCIIGKKGMQSQSFDVKGNVIATTAISAGPCFVVQIKTVARDGYDAIQFGYGEKKGVSKAHRGHIKDVGGTREGRGFLRLEECRTTLPDGIQRGDFITAGLFQPGDRIDVIGTSKGRGYAGVVKRHGFHGQKASHGHKDQERMPGSIGAGGVQHVFKGKRMAGRMGGARVTVKNLEIVGVDVDRNLIMVKGAVPGAFNSLVTLKSKGEVMLSKPKNESPTSPVSEVEIKDISSQDKEIQNAEPHHEDQPV